MKKILVLMAMVLLIASTAMAIPIPPNLIGYDPNADGKLTYNELVALGSGGGILEDKFFSNFTYAGSAGGGAVALVASDITVVPDATPFNPGFLFTASWAAGSGAFMDSLLQFDVKSLGNPISDISATMISGHVFSGIASVTENTTEGNILLFDSSLGVHTSDTITFNPTMDTIHVSKDIGVNGGTEGLATISGVTNHFSEVPEPATMLLLGSGLLGMGVYARRRFIK